MGSETDFLLAVLRCRARPAVRSFPLPPTATGPTVPEPATSDPTVPEPATSGTTIPEPATSGTTVPAPSTYGPLTPDRTGPHLPAAAPATPPTDRRNP
ncbi:hypothetical protein ABB07_39440 (plasmid) [Streptomyces incarnatus]|uniref:Uncharacterized protein n=1 Tax=Streptomyces incarnatus TaxID=665007 RepID=A0ABN4GUB6_9ACTN|nr:hypothetical protein [Streptomyces incarnatus]AKJ15874.1 hypothetical protein ABB07_39440 [Streptomyces incarnatus]